MRGCRDELHTLSFTLVALVLLLFLRTRVLCSLQVIFFSPPATLKLAELAQTYPLDCCSYMGLDMNRSALRIELYSDVMLAMGGGLGLVRVEMHGAH